MLDQIPTFLVETGIGSKIIFNNKFPLLSESNTSQLNVHKLYSTSLDLCILG